MCDSWTFSVWQLVLQRVTAAYSVWDSWVLTAAVHHDMC